MKSGVIGLMSGDGSSIESFYESHEQDGKTFSHSLQLEEIGFTERGNPILEGEAATETTNTEESISIEETGEIVVTEKPVKDEKYTQVIVVPDEFTIVGSSSGTFAFELLGLAAPGISVTRADLDLNEYADHYYDAPSVDPWQVGFYGNIGEAEKGIVYGQEVFADDEIGEVLERSQINQLGLNYEIDGKKMKITLAESGYAEVYQPSNYSTEDYASFIEKEIMPIASVEG